MLLAISPARWTDPRAAAPEALALREAGVDGLLLRLDAEAVLQPWLRVLLPIWAGDLWLHLRVHGALAAVQQYGLNLHLPSGEEASALRPLAPLGLSQSVHDRSGLQRAQAAGVDRVLLSPIFAPGSKPLDARPPLGLAELAAVCAHPTPAIFALGGITPARAPACRQAGAAGVAAIGAFFDQPGGAAVGRRARAMKAAWDQGLGPCGARG